LIVIIITPYAAACAVIHALTSLTFQQVTLSDNLIGLGNVPAATLRHNVGALNGRGATALSAFFELRTSCDSRTIALSGNASKTGSSGESVGRF
jgi:NADPH-dependent curcumin reductase CurA